MLLVAITVVSDLLILALHALTMAVAIRHLESSAASQTLCHLERPRPVAESTHAALVRLKVLFMELTPIRLELID